MRANHIGKVTRRHGRFWDFSRLFAIHQGKKANGSLTRRVILAVVLDLRMVLGDEVAVAAKPERVEHLIAEMNDIRRATCCPQATPGASSASSRLHGVHPFRQSWARVLGADQN